MTSQIRLVANEAERLDALRIEADVFEEQGFLDTGHYDAYEAQSRIWAASDGDGCRGMIRLFHGRPLLPPALALVDQVDDRDFLVELSAQGRLEEFSIAVARRARSVRLFLDLVRAGYRDSRRRGVTHYFIVMEPRRVAAMNRRFAFTYQRCGPDQHYAGEAHITAPFLLSFAEQEASLMSRGEDYLRWQLFDPLDAPMPGRPKSAET